MPKSVLGVGSKAPNFQLKDAQGHDIVLLNVLEQAPVLLIFYPGDMTPGCTVQLCAIRDDWDRFQAAGIQVFGVNPANAISHTKFIDQEGYPFSLLVDPDRKVAKNYGAEQDLILAKIVKRTVVGIGKDGKILFYRHGMPKNADILKAFKK